MRQQQARSGSERAEAIQVGEQGAAATARHTSEQTGKAGGQVVGRSLERDLHFCSAVPADRVHGKVASVLHGPCLAIEQIVQIRFVVVLHPRKVLRETEAGEHVLDAVPVACKDTVSTHTISNEPLQIQRSALQRCQQGEGNCALHTGRREYRSVLR
eukprot:135479-Rhodomonas_salina.1